MVISRLSVLVLGDFGLVHTILVAVSGRFKIFQYISGSAANGHGVMMAPTSSRRVRGDDGHSGGFRGVRRATVGGVGSSCHSHAI